MLRFLIICFFPFFASATSNHFKITTSIRPLQSIVANLTAGINDDVNLVVEQEQTLHSFYLKPSKVKLLYDSDILIYVDDNFELFLRKMASNLRNKKKHVIEAARTDGIKLIEKKHSHDKVHEHHEDHNHSHSIGQYDLHFWLDVDQVKIVAAGLCKFFKEIDPNNSAAYENNLSIFNDKLTALDKEIASKLLNVKDKEYLVTHDAYSYYVKRYGLKPPHTMTIDHDHNIGAKTFHNLYKKVQNNEVSCIFEEPQFSSRVIEKIKSGSNVKLGVLDAEWGPKDTSLTESYFAMMRKLTENFVECLK